jgi:tetratricopeptide (TPR) repeat protein
LGTGAVIFLTDVSLGGRDWDLLSYPALFYTMWGMACLHFHLRRRCFLRLLRWTVVPLVSCHTLLWIGINADEDRALSRLENLLQYANLPPHYRYWTLGYYYTNVLDRHYDRAVHYFTKAVAAAPDDQLVETGSRPYSYRKFLAVALGTSGQYLACIEESRAIYALQSEPVLDENDLAVHQEYAESLLKLAQQADDEGDSSSALVYWRESLTPLGVLARETEDALSFWNLSAAHRRLGNHVQSIEDFRRSLGMSQDPEADMIALGDLYLNEGEKELAATAYAQLLIPTVGGVSSDGFKRAGVRLYKVGHLDESCMAYEAALVVDPLNHLARMNLAWNRYLQHRFDEAIRHYQLVIAQRETGEAAFGLSLAYLHAGHVDSAWVAYGRAVEHFGADGGRRVMAAENLRRFVSRDIQPQAAAAILETYWP